MRFKFSKYTHLLTILTTVALSFTACQQIPIVDKIPPQSLTETRLILTYVRIEKFWNEHGKIPATPAELPNLENRDCSMLDGWERELNWALCDTSRIKVWSLGADGKPGGTGLNEDLEIEFDGDNESENGLPTIKRIH